MNSVQRNQCVLFPNVKTVKCRNCATWHIHVFETHNEHLNCPDCGTSNYYSEYSHSPFFVIEDFFENPNYDPPADDEEYNDEDDYIYKLDFTMSDQEFEKLLYDLS